MKNYMLIIVLFLTVHIYGQEIPLPECCFPLNGTNAENIMSGQAGEIHGKAYALADRFGTGEKAVSFDAENSFLSFPLTTVGGQVRKEATFTYWMYVGKEAAVQAFWAKDNNGNVLLGMGRNGLNALLNIYHKDSGLNVLPDRQWMWSDSNFNEGEGWYFVAVVYSEDGTFFYLTTPTGKRTECYSAFVPDWDLVSSICIGTLDGIPAAGMDDFKVYGTALSGEQLAILYRSESQLGMGNEALINVGTNNLLYSSTWYFHCAGLQEDLRYVLQRQSDLSFVSADAGYALSMTPDVDSDLQRWLLNLVEDTSKGRVYTIANAATGMNLTGMPEGAIQGVTDNSDSQKWYMGQWEGSGQVKREVEQTPPSPLKEEIYYDKDAGVIRIHIVLPEPETVKVKLVNSQGALIHELCTGKVQSLQKNIRLQTNGIYIVAVESANYRINKKISINN